jgi:hypothetical protein
MHYERAALMSGVNRDVGKESEEKIGKSAEEWHFTLSDGYRHSEVTKSTLAGPKSNE